MTRRNYDGEGITVHWDSDRCIHSLLCVLGAPAVFDRGSRPWVHATAASADEIARVIDTCPSGALSYTRTDGGPSGRRGRGHDEDATRATRSDDESAPEPLRPVALAAGTTVPTITPLPDGPLLVEGPFGIARGEGTVEIVQRVTLCRCGQSENKPHCDGSHARVGFVASGSAPASEVRVVIRASPDQPS